VNLRLRLTMTAPSNALNSRITAEGSGTSEMVTLVVRPPTVWVNVPGPLKKGLTGVLAEVVDPLAVQQGPLGL